MENKAYRLFIANIWLGLSLVAIILVGCSLIETPPSAVPVVTELTATPTAQAEPTKIASLTPTSRTASPETSQLTASSTPPAMLTPDSYSRQRDTMPSLASPASPTPGTPGAVFIVLCIVDLDALQLRGCLKIHWCIVLSWCRMH